MDILNFISWIRGGRKFTTVNPSQTLLPAAVKDPKRDDQWLTGAISVDDFAAQVGPYAPAGPQGLQGPIGPQGVPGPVGPAGLNWQGAWSSSGTYVVDDAVGYAGASYFCINNVSLSAMPPSADTVNWALLASQGATGPQGPQGVQGPAGSGGVPGTTVGQTTYWNGTQWTPTLGLYNNGSLSTASRVGIGGINSTAYNLNINTTGLGFRVANSVVNGGVSFQFQTNSSFVNSGINGATHPLPNSFFIGRPDAAALVFNNGNTNRIIIQANGQVTIGSSLAANTTANLVVKNNDIEVEQISKGLILKSPDGTRYRVSVANGGTISIAAV
jgi:hypothetical protein